MPICEEMYSALRAEWIKIEGGRPDYTGDYPAMEWAMHPKALADLRIEDDRGRTTKDFLQPSGSGFEYMGLPIREDVSVERWKLVKIQ